MRRKNSRWPYTLRELELFAGCNHAELNHIASVLSGVTIHAGEVLICEGNHDRQFAIIADGHAVVTHGKGASKRELADVGSGSFVGEISLLDNVPRGATVTAVTPLSLYVCNEQEFRTLLASAPSVGAKIRRAACERRDLLTAAA